MKMEIHKLQMVQYASSDYDSRSEASLQSSEKITKFSSAENGIENKVKLISGF